MCTWPARRRCTCTGTKSRCMPYFNTKKAFLFLFMLKREVSNIDILYRASWLARWRRVQARGVAWSPTQLTCALWAGAGGSSHPAPTRPTTAQAPAPSLSHRYPRQSEVSRDLSQKFTYNILIFGFIVHNISVFRKFMVICEALAWHYGE